MLSTQHKVPSPQCRWIRTERTMCAGFAARGRSGQQGRELHWSAPVKFAAVRSSPWLRAGPTSPNKHPHHTQDKGPTNKHPTNQTPTDRSQKPTRDQKQGGGGEAAKDHNNWVAPKKSGTNSIRGNRPEHQKEGTKTREERQETRRNQKTEKAPQIRGSRNKEKGEAQEGAEQTTNTGTPTQRKEKGSRKAAADRRRKGAQGPERVLTCLSGCPKGDLEHQGWIPQCSSAEQRQDAPKWCRG